MGDAAAGGLHRPWSSAGWRLATPPSRNGSSTSTPGTGGPIALLLLGTVMAVAVPIKIWNNTRIQMNLEQHQQLLLKARMDALSSQINPHFLFNTLNTVSSLIRYDPDLARVVVLKLSNILRRLLRKHEAFVPLHEELGFVDDYLDIEVARFGRDNLQIFKQVDQRHAGSLCAQHAAAADRGEFHQARPGGQTRRRPDHHPHVLADGRLVIEVEDNGVGIPEERMAQVYVDGIGISNVHERLRVLYGGDFRMDISSQEGAGTRIRIEVPELVSEMRRELTRSAAELSELNRAPVRQRPAQRPLLADVPALGGFFAVLVDVLDDLLVNQQVGASEARELDAIAVVPLDRAVQLFAIGEHDGHRRARLHLLHPIEIFGVGLLGRRGLLVRLRPAEVDGVRLALSFRSE